MIVSYIKVIVRNKIFNLKSLEILFYRKRKDQKIIVINNLYYLS